MGAQKAPPPKGAQKAPPPENGITTPKSEFYTLKSDFFCHFWAIFFNEISAENFAIFSEISAENVTIFSD